MTAWLLIAFLAPTVLVVFYAVVWDFDRLCADVERRTAYLERKQARVERLDEDWYWWAYGPPLAECARCMNEAREATVKTTATLPSRVKFFAADTLRVVQ